MKSQDIFVALAALSRSVLGMKYTETKLHFHPPALQMKVPVTTGNATFQQLLNHDDPSAGTFSQQFWWNDEWWDGPGSPVVLFTPGEIAAEGYQGYLTNQTITGAYAQAIKGAVVMLEHRYWGDSSPYANLTTENLQQLTLKNSIADLTYFAKTVKLPFDKNGSSNAPQAPWVLSGGSYSGALSAWTESTAPGTFWAYHSSSAPVQAVFDYWQYFYPIQQGMAKNCSSDISLVVDHIDGILTNGTASQVKSLKAMFGLQDLEHNDDFAAAIENGPWLWQSNQFYTNYSGFYQFCDFIENVAAAGNFSNSTIPGPSGVGLQKALTGYAKWFKTILLPGYCESYGYSDFDGTHNIECFDTYNTSSPLYTDYSVGNAFDRQWNWFLCNEPFAYWQDGAPTDRPSIVSRLVTGEYWQRQCPLFFPKEGNYTYGSGAGKNVSDVNAFTGGWDITNSTRLTWTTGEFDPWRTTGVESQFRPGGQLQSTPQHPVNMIPNGIHCSDLLLHNAQVNEGVQNVVNTEVKQIVEWVQEFYNQTKS